jgi:hypothetical protein
VAVEAAPAAPAEPYTEPYTCTYVGSYQASDDDLDASFFEQPAPTPTQEELDAELAGLEELHAILGVK